MPPITVEIRPSRRMQVLLMTVHFLAMGALPLLHLSMVLKLLLCAAVMVSLWWSCPSWRAAAVTSLHLYPKGRCEIQTRGDGRRMAKLNRQARLGDYMLVLDLSDERCRHQLVLLGDSADADALRQLRVWLRMAV